MWFGVPWLPSFCTGRVKTVQVPAGFEVLLTAMSRWLRPFRAWVVGAARSSVSTTWKNRWVSWSKRQTGSVMEGPNWSGFFVRSIAGAYP